MARPRMFVSSTYYDLKYVRADLMEFGEQFGLEPVLFERGHVAYEADREMEESCFREIEHCDLMISIIGGRSGTKAKTDAHASISQMEVRKAHEMGRHILCFIEKNVYAEYSTWERNPELAKDIQWSHVDNVAVFQFINELKGFQLTNVIFPFETSQEIVQLLREQLAGLFQTLLQRKSRTTYESRVDRLIKATEDLSEIVNFLQREKVASQGIIREILFTRHSLFRELQGRLGIEARVFFETLEEAEKLLPYFGFQKVAAQELDHAVNERFMFWTRKVGDKKREYVGLSRALFDGEGRLKHMSVDEWREDFVSVSPQLSRKALR